MMYLFLIDGTLASQWVKNASLSRLWMPAGNSGYAYGIAVNLILQSTWLPCFLKTK